MKRCRLKRNNFQIINDMSKENKTSDKQQNGNDFIADVMAMLPTNEEIQYHIEKNTRHNNGESAMDEQTFYEGAKWLKEEFLQRVEGN